MPSPPLIILMIRIMMMIIVMIIMIKMMIIIIMIMIITIIAIIIRIMIIKMMSRKTGDETSSNRLSKSGMPPNLDKKCQTHGHTTNKE